MVNSLTIQEIAKAILRRDTEMTKEFLYEISVYSFLLYLLVYNQ